MDSDRIRQALERELGEGYSFWFPYGKRIQIFKLIDGASSHSIVDASPTELAAIGCALQSAAGEGPLIPLADAVRVVEEFFWPDDRTGQRAIAALQALGGGE